MKRIWQFVFILFLLSIPTTVADDRPYKCFLEPRIDIFDNFVTLNLTSKGYYFPDLIENEFGYYYIKIKTIGNWSHLRRDLELDAIVLCDGIQRTRVVSFDDVNVLIENKTIITEFSANGNFFIPEGNTSCSLILSEIYAWNMTWEAQNNCDRAKDNCKCFVDGLTRVFRHDDVEVLTKEQFFAKKSLEITKEISNDQFLRDLTTTIIGAIIGGIFVIIGVFLERKSR